MENKIKNLFITGLPRTGKTTLIKEIIKKFPLAIKGFFTEEIVDQQKERLGFRIVNTNNQSGLFALKHNFKNLFSNDTNHKILHYKKYDVFIDVLENIGVEYVKSCLSEKKYIIVIDEIGAMECMSLNFCSLVTQIINSEIPFIATIRYKSHPFTDDIKRIKESEIYFLDKKNFNQIQQKLEQQIKLWMKELLFY